MANLERYQKKTCPDCDGEGQRGDICDGYYPTGSEDISYSCDECDGSGKIDCPDCPGDEEIECGNDDCWEGKIDCPHCDGNGYLPYHCDECGEELDHDYFHPRSWVTDGAMICDDCARKAGAYKCETCNGVGELDHEEVTLEGKTFKTVAASCSCCGAASIRADDPPRHFRMHSRDNRNGFDHFVYRASMMDTDGVYFSYLCGDENGEGCLSEVLEQQEDVKISPHSKDKQAKLDAVGYLFGDDEDGRWSEMTD